MVLNAWEKGSALYQDQLYPPDEESPYWSVVRNRWILHRFGMSYDGPVDGFEWHDYGIVVCAWAEDMLPPAYGVGADVIEEMEREVAIQCAWEMYAIPRLLGIFLSQSP